MSIVFIFSWERRRFQGKLETMLMQNLEGQTKSIVVFLKVAHRVNCPDNCYINNPHTQVNTYLLNLPDVIFVH